MAAIFKPLRGSRFRAACGASCAAQCVLRLLPTHSNLYALGPGEIGSRPVVCGAGPQGTALARRGGVAASQTKSGSAPRTCNWSRRKAQPEGLWWCCCL